MADSTWTQILRQYRKTFWPMQGAMLIICIALIWHWKVPIPSSVVYFLFMEVCAFLGAMWAVRLRNKVQNDRERLPLNRR